MAHVTYSKWPHIDRAPDRFLAGLAQRAARHGWDHDAIAGVISHESGFRPEAKNPKGTAAGLMQWIDSTARAIGTSSAAIQRMGWADQLDVIERYLLHFGQGRGLSGADVFMMGVGASPGLTNQVVIHERGEPAYDWNVPAGAECAVWDVDCDGIVTAGDLRAYWARWADQAAARGQVVVPAKLARTARARSPGLGFGWVMAFGMGTWAWYRWRRRRADAPA